MYTQWLIPIYGRNKGIGGLWWLGHPLRHSWALCFHCTYVWYVCIHMVIAVRFERAVTSRLMQTLDRLMQTLDRLMQTLDRLMQTLDRLMQTLDRLMQTLDRLMQTLDRLMQTLDRLMQTLDRLMQTLDCLIRCKKPTFPRVTAVLHSRTHAYSNTRASSASSDNIFTRNSWTAWHPLWSHISFRYPSDSLRRAAYVVDLSNDLSNLRRDGRH